MFKPLVKNPKPRGRASEGQEELLYVGEKKLADIGPCANTKITTCLVFKTTQVN